jgi:hypothetical protein
MVADEVRYLGAKARELLDAFAEDRPGRRLATFGDVERLWTQVVEPALPTFRTLQPKWTDTPPIPEDSCWHANSAIP